MRERASFGVLVMIGAPAAAKMCHWRQTGVFYQMRNFTRPISQLSIGAALLAVGTAASASAQRTTGIRERAAAEAVRPPSAYGVIDGVVTDTLLRPLESADISVVGVGAHVVTSINGRFRMLQVPPGQYLLVARRIGYAPTSGIIQVPAEDTVRLSYALLRSNNLLDTVKVQARRVSLRMAEFEGRRRQGIGQFVTQEDLERRGSPQVADFLRNIRGIELLRNTSQAFGDMVAISRREGDAQQGGCPMQVVLDGIVLPGKFNLDLLPSPKQIAGIEVYSGPATVPPQFGGNDRRCGLIAVWTREGY